MKRVRFSLATLLLSVLLIATASSLYLRWNPWVRQRAYNIDAQVAHFSPDEQRILLRDEDSISIISASDGAIQLTLPFRGWGDICGFSANGRHIFFPEAQDLIAVRDVVDCKLVTWIERPGSYFRQASISPDGKTLFTSEDDGPVRSWNAETGAELAKFEPGGDAVFVSHNGRMLAIAGDAGVARICDSQTGATISSIPAGCESVAFSPADDWVVTSHQETGLTAWNLVAGTATRRWDSERRILLAPVFAPDGKTIHCGGWFSEDAIIDAQTGEILWRFDIERLSWIAEWSKDGSRLLIAGWDNVQIWKRTRPEWRWGVFFLPELWTTALFSILLILRALKSIRTKTPI